MDTRKLERTTKGVANHRRIQIMELLGEHPDLSVFQVANSLRVNFKTISEHLRRLTHAGLVLKTNKGNEVQHVLTDKGRTILKFLRTLE